MDVHVFVTMVACLLVPKHVMVLPRITTPITPNKVVSQSFVQQTVHRKYWSVQLHLRQMPTIKIELTTVVERLQPKRGPHYNPSYGYEPYWPGGDWVFKTTTVHPNDTTSGLCGVQCSAVYVRYGVICGRNKYRNESRTFANYCAMRSVDCLGRHGWFVAHRGKCRPPVKLHTAHSIAHDLYTRTPWHVNAASRVLYNFSARYGCTPIPNTTTV